MKEFLLLSVLLALFKIIHAQESWQSKFIKVDANGRLEYMSNERGNIIPDFSGVGYASGEREIPIVGVVEVIEALQGDNRDNIQKAIDRISERIPDENGFRGALLLKQGTYNINGTITINHSGIVLRGEGTGKSGTVLRETAVRKCNLFEFSGSGTLRRQESSRVRIKEDFVPVGRKYVEVENASGFKIGDSVLICRPGTDEWISDLKMDQIVEREGTSQWKASGYNLYFERIVTAIEKNKLFLDYPVVMQMEQKYGGGYVVKYNFRGRIKECGIENLYMESTYAGEFDENHGWDAISFRSVSHAWVKNVVSRYFGHGCVSIDSNSRNITVLDSQCLDAKSIITGSRRYSFSTSGQFNLFKNCYSTEGRHCYAAGARVAGPNVFTQCKSINTHSDIGPHHRWTCGTLYDMIDTDGEINVQDRGNYGTGHGWAGVEQVIWNCRSPKVAVQSPWVSGKNYCIGLIGGKYPGRFTDRPDGEWEGFNRPGLIPESLYEAQLRDRLLKKNEH